MPALDALHAAGHRIVAVYTQPDRPAGRGQTLDAEPGEAARAASSACRRAARHAQVARRPSARSARTGSRPDGGRGLRADPAAGGARRAAARLPATSTPRCCRAGAARRRSSARSSPATTRTGITIMQMDAGSTPGRCCCARELADRAARDRRRACTTGSRALGAEAIVAADRRAGRLAASRRRRSRREGATYAAKIRKEEARIDWAQPAVAIDRQVRAFNPWPVAETPLATASSCASGRRSPCQRSRRGAGAVAGTVVEAAAGRLRRGHRRRRARAAAAAARRPQARMPARASSSTRTPLAGARLRVSTRAPRRRRSARARRASSSQVHRRRALARRAAGRATRDEGSARGLKRSLVLRHAALALPARRGPATPGDAPARAARAAAARAARGRPVPAGVGRDRGARRRGRDRQRRARARLRAGRRLRERGAAALPARAGRRACRRGPRPGAAHRAPALARRRAARATAARPRWPILEANNAHPPMWLRVNRMRGDVARAQRPSSRPRASRSRRTRWRAGRAAGRAARRRALAARIRRGPAVGAGRGRPAGGRAARRRSRASASSTPARRRAARPATCSSGSAGHADLTALDVVRAAPRAGPREPRAARPAGATCGPATPRTPAAWWDGRPFDRILLDVPCSATGVIRRHPDIKLLRRARDIPALARRQAEPAARGLGAARPGGTPALHQLLGAARPRTSASSRPSWPGRPAARDRTPDLTRGWPARPAGAGPGYQVLPGEAGMDGFYYACLSKPL